MYLSRNSLRPPAQFNRSFLLLDYAFFSARKKAKSRTSCWSSGGSFAIKSFKFSISKEIGLLKVNKFLKITDILCIVQKIGSLAKDSFGFPTHDRHSCLAPGPDSLVPHADMFGNAMPTLRLNAINDHFVFVNRSRG